MRNIKVVNVNVPAYWDDDGNPTCALDFREHLVCPLYYTEKYGVLEKCGYTGATLDRRKDGMGTLVPCSKCPIHVMEGV